VLSADDRGLVLFEPAVGPLPQAHPGKLPFLRDYCARNGLSHFATRRSGSTPVDGPVNAIFTKSSINSHTSCTPDETDQPPRNRRISQPLARSGSEQLRPMIARTASRPEWQFPERSLARVETIAVTADDQLHEHSRLHLF